MSLGKNDRAFTLFEVLIYIAILAVIMYFVGGFAYNIYMGKDKIQAIQEVNTNGRFMINEMTESIEKAKTVNILQE